MSDVNTAGPTEGGAVPEGEVPDRLRDVRFVGPATATVLQRADVEPRDFVAKRVSYTQLVEAGVNPGVAARIRREHSLSWSFESSGEDLGRRSAQVRGLDEEERDWVAASAGDWEQRAEAYEPADAEAAAEGDDGAAAADGSGDPTDAERAWRERSAPDPVAAVEGVDEALARQLERGGITSVRSLANADVDHAATALAVDRDRLVALRERARDLTD